MPRKAKKATKKLVSKSISLEDVVSKAISLEDAVDAVASAIAMSVIAQHGSEADRREAVAWLKSWFSHKDVFGKPNTSQQQQKPL